MKLFVFCGTYWRQVRCCCSCVRNRARVARTCAADATDRAQQWLRCSLNVHGSEDGMRMQAAMRTSRVFAQICARHWNRRTRLSIQVL